MPRSVAVQNPQFVTGTDARRMLGGIGYRAFETLVRGGHVKPYLLPGLPPRYSRSDVERLAREATERQEA